MVRIRLLVDSWIAFAACVPESSAQSWMSIDWDTWSVHADSKQLGTGISDFAMSRNEGGQAFVASFAVGSPSVAVSTVPLAARQETISGQVRPRSRALATNSNLYMRLPTNARQMNAKKTAG